jgi:hypothetical protein
VGFRLFEKILRLNRWHFRPVALPDRLHEYFSAHIVVDSVLLSLLFLGYELLLSFRELVFGFGKPVLLLAGHGSLLMRNSAKLKLLNELACACQRLHMLTWNFDINHVNQTVSKTST